MKKYLYLGAALLAASVAYSVFANLIWCVVAVVVALGLVKVVR